MTAPTYVAAASNIANDTGGAWAHTTAVPAAGRLIVCHVFQDGTSASNAVTISSATNCTNIAGTANLYTPIAATGFGIGSGPNGYHYIFFARATGVNTSVITGANSGSDDIYIRTYQFTDVNAGLTLDRVIENINPGATLSARGTSASVAPSAVTTRNVDRLAVGFIAVADDIQGAELTAMAGETGGDWTYPVAAVGLGTGTDGTLGLINAAMALPGLLTGGGDAITSEAWGVITFALIGTTAEYQPRSPDYPVDMR